MTTKDHWELLELFHRMWGKAASGDPYCKRDWVNLQELLEKAERVREEGVEPITPEGTTF